MQLLVVLQRLLQAPGLLCYVDEMARHACMRAQDMVMGRSMGTAAVSAAVVR